MFKPNPEPSTAAASARYPIALGLSLLLAAVASTGCEPTIAEGLDRAQPAQLAAHRHQTNEDKYAVAQGDIDPASPAAVAPVHQGLGAGEACFAGSECATGVCEGTGCGDDQPGRCAGVQRACTYDLQPYCDCEGQTFHSSGTCPGRRFQHKGACE